MCFIIKSSIINLLLFVVVNLLIFNSVDCQRFAGDSCIIENNGQSGICVSLINCPIALNELQKYQRLPQTCGFEGTTPIVCCPQTNQPVITPSTTTRTTTTTTTTTQKITTNQPLGDGNYPSISNRIAGEVSRLKCVEYGKYVYVKKKPAVTTILNSDDTEIVKYECGHTETPLIVGGTVAKNGEFPHMALIGYEPTSGSISWSCGGSLISPQFVLTAAHCVTDRSLGDAKYVRIGVDNKLSQTGQLLRVIQSYRHPNHQAPIHYNDIGLLKLESLVRMTPKTRPACLYTNYDINRQRAIASGWGRVEYAGRDSDDLLKVTLELKTQPDCNSSYENQIGWKLQDGILYDTQVCAGASDEDVVNKDTCQGDSGGPLQIYHPKENVKCMYDIVGITSFGKACGLGKFPGVYTRVSAYIKWIEDIVWP